MNHSIREELCEHLIDCINDGVLTNDNVDEWHHHAFNANYYIIGYYNAEQWLKYHDVSAFEATGECIDYERETFGEVHKTYDDAETTVNMYVYIKGEELLAELSADNVDCLLEDLQD